MARKKADKPVTDLEMTNNEVKMENKRQLRELEKMYVDGVIDNLDEIVNKRKNELILQLQNFYLKLEEKPNLRSPFIINTYFFKSINPMPNCEPKYTAEKLGIVWDLYNHILCEVNMEIGEILPTLSNFCRFAGITLTTFKSYKNSPDEAMRVVIEKISDLCFDTQVTMAQVGAVKERSTIYRMKAEQERVEKETPAIHIHQENVDLGEIANRLKEIKQYNFKKNAIEAEGGVVDAE